MHPRSQRSLRMGRGFPRMRPLWGPAAPTNRLQASGGNAKPKAPSPCHPVSLSPLGSDAQMSVLVIRAAGAG